MAKSKSQVNRIIANALAMLGNEIEIDAAILFGSYAAGKAGEYSDIDLAVFSSTVEDWSLSRKIKLASKVKAAEPMVELHIYPKSAFKDARPTNFYGHIMETGKKVA